MRGAYDHDAAARPPVIPAQAGNQTRCRGLSLRGAY